MWTLHLYIIMAKGAFSSIIRLSVIALSVVALNRPVAVAELFVKPLWDLSDGMEHPCQMGEMNYSLGGLILHGSPQHTCSLQINSSLQTRIEVLEDEKESVFLDIERHGDLVDCNNKYLIIKAGKANAVCGTVLSQESYTLNLQGNVSIIVRGSRSLGSHSQCPESSDSISTNCTGVKGYGFKFVCERFPYDNGGCKFTLPPNCNATLGGRDVELHCIDDDGLLTIQYAMIRYPIDITVLYLNFNNIFGIKDYSWEWLPNLQRLELTNNHQLTILTAGAFRGLHKLYKLLLYRNNLVDLQVGLFQDLGMLKDLNMYLNQLTTLRVGLLRGLRNLMRLELGGNQLVHLDVTTFNGVTMLTELEMSYNNLTTLPVGLFNGLENLRKLDLTGNQLVTLYSNTFQGLPMLMNLYMGANNLVSIPDDLFDNLGNLESVYLDKNQITTMNLRNFQGLPKLRSLRLNENKLNSLTGEFIGRFEDFTYFDIQSNQLDRLNPKLFDNLDNLRILDLGNNKLTALPKGVFKNLRNLQYLVLDDNYLEELDADSFHGLFSLAALLVRNNKIKEVDIDIFKDTTVISYIVMSNNKLKTFPITTHLTLLNHLDLINNTLLSVTSDTFSAMPNKSELFVSQHEICQCYIPNTVTVCSALYDRSPYLTCDRLLSDTVLAVMMWLIGVNALCGNILVMIWRKRNTRKYKVQDLLLINLAMSDSLMGIYMIIIACADIYYGDYFPMQSESWRSGIICRIAGSISIASSEASVFFVTLISIDRFIHIKFPYSTNKMGRQSTIVTAALIWIVSIASGVVPSVLSGRNFKFYDNSHVCVGLPLALTKTFRTEKVITFNFQFYSYKDTYITEFTGYANGLYYSTALFLGLNCFCFLVILVCYIEIVRAVIVSSKQSGRTPDVNEQIKLTTKVSAIVLTDFACWSPLVILGILVQTRVITLPPSVFAWAVSFVLPLNSAINPYLYTLAEIISNYRKKNGEKNVSQSTVVQNTDAL